MFQPDLLAGKQVLITGGGTGLGRSMAQRYLELGAAVMICGRRKEVLAETTEAFAADHGTRIRWLACDIRDAAAVEDMIGQIWRERPLDILVNNAAGNFIARTETLSPRALDAVINIVLHGTAYVTLACGKRWIEAARPGCVLSLVATYAFTGSPYVVPSAMAKAGVLAMTRSLAAEWGRHGIRLNAIAPGPFPTAGAWERLVPTPEIEAAWRRRIPLGRFGEHRELADLATFMVSDGASFMTGEVVTLDGGEWVKGAGQFSMVEDLSEDDWAAMRGKKS